MGGEEGRRGAWGCACSAPRTADGVAGRHGLSKDSHKTEENFACGEGPIAGRMSADNNKQKRKKEDDERDKVGARASKWAEEFDKLSEDDQYTYLEEIAPRMTRMHVQFLQGIIGFDEEDVEGEEDDFEEGEEDDEEEDDEEDAKGDDGDDE